MVFVTKFVVQKRFVQVDFAGSVAPSPLQPHALEDVSIQEQMLFTAEVATNAVLLVNGASMQSANAPTAKQNAVAVALICFPIPNTVDNVVRLVKAVSYVPAVVA